MSKYSPQKHEWGTDASVKRAKELTPNEGRKVKRFKDFAKEEKIECPKCKGKGCGHCDNTGYHEKNEATYQGKKVPLNKPMPGDVKKSKVYVDPDGDGKAKKVNFGDKKMRIKKSNPARRKSFRARHNCDNPGPKDKARYWSCKAW